MTKSSIIIFITNHIAIIVILVVLLISALYTYLTPFERRVTVKEKYNYASGAGKGLQVRNSIYTTDGKVYVISNSLWRWFFRSAELLLSIEINKTYDVKGFGLRIPILGLFPVIIDAKEVK